LAANLFYLRKIAVEPRERHTKTEQTNKKKKMEKNSASQQQHVALPHAVSGKSGCTARKCGQHTIEII